MPNIMKNVVKSERPRRGRSPVRSPEGMSNSPVTELSIGTGLHDHVEQTHPKMIVSYLQSHQDQVRDIAQFIGYAYDKESNDLGFGCIQ